MYDRAGLMDAVARLRVWQQGGRRAFIRWHREPTLGGVFRQPAPGEA